MFCSYSLNIFYNFNPNLIKKFVFSHPSDFQAAVIEAVMVIIMITTTETPTAAEGAATAAAMGAATEEEVAVDTEITDISRTNLFTLFYLKPSL